VTAFGPTDQGDFLLALGAAQRHEALMRTATEGGRDTAQLDAGFHRLVNKDDSGMGHTYKVLALASGNMVPPPFLAAAPRKKKQ
jgi:SAM-dependent MidA family methyltransferase